MSSVKKNPWGNKSYADLIAEAINQSPDHRLTLSEIYDWMVKNIPHFSDKGNSRSSAGWKNSIRHNLSLHTKFVRMQSDCTGKGGSWWIINPDASNGRVTNRKRPLISTTRRRNRSTKSKISATPQLNLSNPIGRQPNYDQPLPQNILFSKNYLQKNDELFSTTPYQCRSLLDFEGVENFQERKSCSSSDYNSDGNGRESYTESPSYSTKLMGSGKIVSYLHKNLSLLRFHDHNESTYWNTYPLLTYSYEQSPHADFQENRDDLDVKIEDLNTNELLKKKDASIVNIDTTRSTCMTVNIPNKSFSFPECVIAHSTSNYDSISSQNTAKNRNNALYFKTESDISHALEIHSNYVDVRSSFTEKEIVEKQKLCEIKKIRINFKTLASTKDTKFTRLTHDNIRIPNDNKLSKQLEYNHHLFPLGNPNVKEDRFVNIEQSKEMSESKSKDINSNENSRLKTSFSTFDHEELPLDLWDIDICPELTCDISKILQADHSSLDFD